MSVTVDIDLRDKLDGARDQGQRPTCVVFAVSSAHEFKRGQTEYLSTEYLFYSGAQRTHKDPKQGLTRAAVREALMQDGQPPESVWPYGEAAPDVATWKPPTQPTSVHTATVDFASRTVAEVRALVKAGAPVVLIVSATLAMYAPDLDAVVRVSANDKVTGRHALLAVGSGHSDDGEYLLVRNSWGQAWGAGGHGWLHDPYLAQRLEMTGTIT